MNTKAYFKNPKMFELYAVHGFKIKESSRKSNVKFVVERSQCRHYYTPKL